MGLIAVYFFLPIVNWKCLHYKLATQRKVGHAEQGSVI